MVKKNTSCFRLIATFVVFLFSVNSAFASAIPLAAPSSIASAPKLLNVSEAYNPPMLRGVKFDPKDPLRLQFVIDRGARDHVSDAEVNRLIRYFFAGLTIPTRNFWVNLSPNEPNRIISEELAKTDLGHDMLSEDYVLKQLASSLTYPKSDSGKAYWRALQAGGAASDMMSRVWIVPNKPSVYDGGNVGVLTEAKLKVLTANDYAALNGAGSAKNSFGSATNIFKSEILPLIEKDVNNGKNFARLRQAYSALVLSVWFKKKFQSSFYQYYIDKKSVKGIDTIGRGVKKQIYRQYVESVTKGVYDYAERSAVSADKSRSSVRHYFGGGVHLGSLDNPDGIVRASALPAHDSSSLELVPLAVDHGNYVHEQDTDYETGAGDNHASAPVFANNGPMEMLSHRVEPATYEPGRWTVTGNDGVVYDLGGLFSDETHLARAGATEPLDLLSCQYYMALFTRFVKHGASADLLVIPSDDNAVDGNFLPTAMLTPQQRADLLGRVTLQSIKTALYGFSGKMRIAVAECPFDAGLGENYGRKNEPIPLERGHRYGVPTRLGAKAVDLIVSHLPPVNGNDEEEPLAIAKARVLRSILNASDWGRAGMAKSFIPIVDADSEESYADLFEEPNYFDRKYNDSKPLTNLRALSKEGVFTGLVKCQRYPSIDEQASGAKNGWVPTWDRLGNGSHGEWGFKLLAMALRHKVDPTSPTVGSYDGHHVAFINGDGVNNEATIAIHQWMQLTHTMMALVSTQRGRNDEKIGMPGVDIKTKDVRFLELASAKANEKRGNKGQLERFRRVGLDGGVGQTWGQDANTNNVYFNFDLIAQVVQAIYNEIFLPAYGNDPVKAEAELMLNFLPDLIADPGKVNGLPGHTYTQLEGPICTVMANFHNFIRRMTEKDPRAKTILDRYHVGKIDDNKMRHVLEKAGCGEAKGYGALRIIYTDFSERDDQFGPNKQPKDGLLQRSTDYYIFDQKTLKLRASYAGDPEKILKFRKKLESEGRSEAEIVDMLLKEGLLTIPPEFDFSGITTTGVYPDGKPYNFGADITALKQYCGRMQVKGLEYLKGSGQIMYLGDPKRPNEYTFKAKGKTEYHVDSSLPILSLRDHLHGIYIANRIAEGTPPSSFCFDLPDGKGKAKFTLYRGRIRLYDDGVLYLDNARIDIMPVKDGDDLTPTGIFANGMPDERALRNGTPGPKVRSTDGGVSWDSLEDDVQAAPALDVPVISGDKIDRLTFTVLGRRSVSSFKAFVGRD